MHKVEELLVYQKTMSLVTEIYRITKCFPQEETYGLTSQMRRCAVSIPSNISEGAGRTSQKEFSRFLSIARGSSYELKTQLQISNGLGYTQTQETELIIERIEEIQKMIYSLIQKTS